MLDLQALGVKLIEMGISVEGSVSKAVKQIIEADKTIDVLVNNAGYGSYRSLEDVDLSEARHQLM